MTTLFEAGLASTKLRNAKATTRDGHNRPIVVVTGMGVITSLGEGKTENWAKITAGESGISTIRRFSTHGLKTRIAGTIDFVEVKLDHPVDVEVPLVTTGKAVGVAKGGVLRIVHRLVPVRCLPNLVPVKITTDVTHLELGEHIATQDLKLPEGVVVRLAPTQTLVAVVAPEKEVEEAPAPGAAAATAAAGAAAPGTAGAAGAGAVAAEHLRGGPAVQLHQVSLGASPVEPGVAEVVPEPMRVDRHAGPLPRAGHSLVNAVRGQGSPAAGSQP